MDTIETRVAEFVRSDEWQYIRGLLQERVDVLDSVGALDPTLPNEQLGEEAKARSMAIRIMLDWRDHVEGIQEQEDEPDDKVQVEQIIIEH